jgi:hypothetical protein
MGLFIFLYVSPTPANSNDPFALPSVFSLTVENGGEVKQFYSMVYRCVSYF